MSWTRRGKKEMGGGEVSGDSSTAGYAEVAKIKWNLRYGS